MLDLRIKNGTVVTMDTTNAIVEDDVYIDDGYIVAVGGPEQEAARELDASGMAVIPGMNNLHDHLRDLMPGVKAGEGLKLDDLLRFYWRLNEIAGTTEYQVMAAFSTARLLKAGVTSAVDHIYPFHEPGLAEATVEGYSQTGIRWFMARGLMTKGYDPICESAADAFAKIRELAGGLVPKEKLFIAPVSFRQSEPDDYRQSRELADELGLRLYTHVAETAQEVEMIQEQYGVRPVAFLHQLGFAGEDTVLVHCVLLSEEEIDMLAASGSHVVHCPTNHMKLAKGFTPVPVLLDAGVNVSLGIDMQMDMFREVRQEVLLQSIHNSDPSILSPQTALRMATVGGARALGLEDELGSIEAGKRADLVCVDLSTIRNEPVLDPVWSLVYRAEGSDVAHVVVDGELVVHEGKLTKIDERALTQEAKAVVNAYLERAGLREPAVAA